MELNIVRKNKKITLRYCKDNSILEIIEVLRKDNKSRLWDKLKVHWTIYDWEIYFKLKDENIYGIIKK